MACIYWTNYLPGYGRTGRTGDYALELLTMYLFYYFKKISQILNICVCINEIYNFIVIHFKSIYIAHKQIWLKEKNLGGGGGGGGHDHPGPP